MHGGCSCLSWFHDSCTVPGRAVDCNRLLLRYDDVLIIRGTILASRFSKDKEHTMDLRRDLLPLLKETYSEFQADEASTLGAALGYYALFSLFPLLLLLIAGLG